MSTTMTINELLFKSNKENIESNITRIGALSTYFQQLAEDLHNADLTEIGNNDSVAFYIDDNADMQISEESWNDLLTDDTNSLINNSHWNETVVATWVDYCKYFKDPNRNLEDVLDPWTLDDLRKADAGASFEYDEEFNEEYVIPYINIDEENYKEVRTISDKLIIGVIDNPRFLQYTKNQYNASDSSTHPWLRLLMPMNSRRVEVEDLNRNFWVIGQGVSIICDYLFDDDSPVRKMFYEILREITEQWENMLYLWGDYQLLTGRNSQICLIEDFPVRDLYTPRKFDNFNTSLWKILPSSPITPQIRDVGLLNQRFNYLTQKYSGSCISLLVRAREDNYYKNWYSTEAYPYYGYFDGEQWTWFRLKNNNTTYFKFIVDADYSVVLYGYKQDGNTYKYGKYGTDYPLAAIRVVPKIIQGGKNPSIEFLIYDAVGTMVGKNNNTIIEYYNSEIEQIDDDYWVITMSSRGEPTDSPKSGVIDIDRIETPIYFGEVASKYKGFGGGS